MEVGIRAYTELKDEKNKSKTINLKSKAVNQKPSYSRILVIDTECLSDNPSQALRFGSFSILRDGNIIEKIGLFYNSNILTKSELKELEKYCIKNPITKLYTLEQFIENIFYVETLTFNTPVIFFNAAFDISRISIGYVPARKNMRGGFVFILSKQRKFPRIRIKKLNGSAHIIEFERTQYSRKKGFFIDTMVLSQIMTDSKSISLKKACERYNKFHKKLDVDGYDKINETFLDYAIGDILATGELFIRLKEEYDRFELDLPIHKVFSSASIGKGALTHLGIFPNSDLKADTYGKVLAAYFGGRCQVGIRHTPTLVTVLDFVSLYPSLNILLKFFDMMTSEHIEVQDDTANVKKLLDSINTIDDLRNPEIWKSFCVVCEILPEKDILPIRGKFDNENFSVAVSSVSSKETMYYGLPSIISSKLLTGRTPEIKSALRFTGKGKQSTLKTAQILGVKINPVSEDLFKFLAEERQRSKIAKDGRDREIKILINSTSYGIGIEMNPQDFKSDVMIYSGNRKFSDFRRYEQPGKFFNPIIPTIITDCAKLFLSICEIILSKYGATIAYCDTDSVFVPPQYADEIIEWFDPLCPYNNVKHLLKKEAENVWFYGISAKRYVIFSIDSSGNFIINDDDYSLHGLGHLQSPFRNSIEHWHKIIWHDILDLHYNRITIDELLNKYRDYYGISKFVVSTSSLMKRFNVLNKGKNYDDMITPFNFFLIAFSNVKDVKPIAPFSKDPQTMPYSKFINYKDGSLMEGQHYFKTLADELYSYINRPESKMSGSVGILHRKTVVIDSIVCIGKESERMGNDIVGLDKIDYNTSIDPKDIEKIFSRTWKEVKQCGIPESQFYALKKQLKEGKRLKLSGKTLKRMRNFLSMEDIS
jgi:hypothetical protein